MASPRAARELEVFLSARLKRSRSSSLSLTVDASRRGDDRRQEGVTQAVGRVALPMMMMFIMCIRPAFFFFSVEPEIERCSRPRHTCALAASVAGQEAFFSALAGHRCGVYRGGPRSCFPRSRPVLYRPHVVRARNHPASWRSALCSSTQGRIWPRLFTILFARLMSFLRKST